MTYQLANDTVPKRLNYLLDMHLAALPVEARGAIRDSLARAAQNWMTRQGIALTDSDDFGSDVTGEVQVLLMMAALRTYEVKEALDATAPWLNSWVAAAHFKHDIFETYQAAMTGEPEAVLGVLEKIIAKHGWSTEEALNAEI